MSEKRRDKRNRILHNGETQRKDGRYRFKYLDSEGKEKYVYSWRLDHNDPYPKGKRKDLSLREKEKQIEQDMFHQIVSNGGNYTVLSLVEKYVSLKTGVRHNTKAGYKTVINVLKKDDFGSKRIDKVKLSDASIGKNICNISGKSITAFTKCQCRKLPLMYAGTRSVPTWQKVR